MGGGGGGSLKTFIKVVKLNERLLHINEHYNVYTLNAFITSLQPRDLPELRVALLAEWNELPQNNFNRLVRSTRHRCQAVIDARGGNTQY